MTLEHRFRTLFSLAGCHHVALIRMMAGTRHGAIACLVAGMLALATVAQGAPQKTEERSLIEALKAEDTCERLGAVDALGRLAAAPGSSNLSLEGISALSQALGDRSHDVRNAAVQALCRIRSGDVATAIVNRAPYWDSFGLVPKLNRYAAGCVAHMGELALPAIVAALEGDIQHQRQFVFLVLVELKHPKAMALLAKSVNHKRGDVRAAALEAMGKRRDRSSIPTIVKRLNDEVKQVRIAAVQALAAIGKPAIQALIRALNGGKMEVRIEAAEVLGRMKAQGAERALRRAANSPNANLRLSACRSLQKMPTMRTIIAPCRKVLKPQRSSPDDIFSPMGDRSTNFTTGASIAPRNTLEEARRACQQRRPSPKQGR